jgi:excisionase family DNA binding protein
MELKDGAVRVPNACEFLGLPRTTVYELMTNGELKYLKIGNRRLILRSELQKYLARQLVAGAGA